MNDELAATLLSSIETDRLAVFCGAGLSMASPSSLPSAKRLAETCSEDYYSITGIQLGDPERTNLEAMAGYFKGRNEFHSLFIQRLIPWGNFERNPNPGHYALADFLASGIVEFSISTNIDRLIEIASAHLGEPAFYAAVYENDVENGIKEV